MHTTYETYIKSREIMEQKKIAFSNYNIWKVEADFTKLSARLQEFIELCGSTRMEDYSKLNEFTFALDLVENEWLDTEHAKYFLEKYLTQTFIDMGWQTPPRMCWSSVRPMLVVILKESKENEYIIGHRFLAQRMDTEPYNPRKMYGGD